MRSIIAIAALSLASCGGNTVANNAAVADESGGTELTAANDTTAIDAATGEAANMAADVDYSFNESDSNASASNDSSPKASSKKPVEKPTEKPAATAEPAPAEPANSAATNGL